MSIAPIVSVIIVTWNSKKYLRTCLDKLSLQIFHDFEVILVDNNSKDGGLDELQAGYQNLRLYIEKLDSNYGFAVANNIGARLAQGRWLALLNVDAFPEPDWLEKLLLATENNHEYSCFSSRQVQANNPNFLDGAGDAYHVSGLAWRRYMNYPTEGYGQEPVELFGPCAAAAMYSREAFLDVGGFDEDFGSYFEDVDLGFRLQLRGYCCLYVSTATVRHVGSATFGERSDFAFYHSHRNLIWTFVKNMPTAMLWRYLPAHFVANLIYVMFYTLRGRGKVLWRAKWDALRGLRRALQKRREIQKLRCASNADLLRIMEHGWFQPYLLGYKLRRVLANLKKAE